MRKFPKHSGHRRGMPSILIVLVVLIVLLVIWLLWSKFSPDKEIETDETEIQIADELENGDAEQEAEIDAENEPEKPKSPEKSRKINRYPAAPNIASRKPRMLTDGLYILIIKNQHKLQLYRDGKLMKNYKVALGANPEDKRAVGDLRTPEGHFYINFIRDSTHWTHDFGDGLGEIPDAYGPWFMALFTGKSHTFSQNTWTGIGIHGTHKPESIGTDETEGCIRMYNNELEELKEIIGDNEYVSVDIVASL
ncbi:MAG TPA: L,D-transpeptidase [Candidatus Cloacimonetes bacterium]|nr:L,D-transpeptidase [Candidatus Cloacimonadota bacterium]